MGEENIFHITYPAAQGRLSGGAEMRAGLAASLSSFSKSKGGRGQASAQFEKFKIEAISSPDGALLIYALLEPDMPEGRVKEALRSIQKRLSEEYGSRPGDIAQAGSSPFRRLAESELCGLISSPSNGVEERGDWRLDEFWGSL